MSCTASSCTDLEDAHFWIGPKKFEMHVFARFLINEYLRYIFLINKYLRCMFLHVFCTFLYLRYKDTFYKVLTFNSTDFFIITLLTLWYMILSCRSFSIPLKTSISRHYCNFQKIHKRSSWQINLNFLEPGFYGWSNYVLMYWTWKCWRKLISFLYQS